MSEDHDDNLKYIESWLSRTSEMDSKKSTKGSVKDDFNRVKIKVEKSPDEIVLEEEDDSSGEFLMIDDRFNSTSGGRNYSSKYNSKFSKSKSK